MFRRLISSLFIVGILSGCNTDADGIVDQVGRRVVDDAVVLTSQQQISLTKVVKEIDVKHNAEFVVYTLKRIPDTSNIEEFSNKVFNKWKIGKKESDSGLLFVVSTQDRKIRIEVGRGNEGNMPDAVAGDIIRNVMAPNFRAGKYYEGLLEGIRAAEKVVTKEGK